MEFAAVIIIAAAVFGVCYLADKGFVKVFRSKAQHQSGLAVRLSKRYGSIGIVLAVLGLAAVFMGLNGNDGWALPVCGGILVVTGLCLGVYYLTFGVFYDENGFVLTTFGKHSVSYTYKDIQYQQLYMGHGQIIVELHMADGTPPNYTVIWKGHILFWIMPLKDGASRQDGHGRIAISLTRITAAGFHLWRVEGCTYRLLPLTGWHW